MNKSKLVLLVITLLSLSACVQKSSKKTVVVLLHVESIRDVHSVGIRGNTKPLSWESDLELTPLRKDTLYTAIFSLVTGYKFIEAKFTVNGQFELNEQENRRIIFGNKDTCIYEAKFNVVKQ